MLAYHCPACNMPLFKYEGKVICPACKKEAEIIGEGRDAIVRLKEDRKEVVEEKKEEKVVVEERRVEEVREVGVEENVKRAILKISERISKISDYEDVQTIKDLVDILERLVNVLERVKRMKIH